MQTRFTAGISSNTATGTAGLQVQVVAQHQVFHFKITPQYIRRFMHSSLGRKMRGKKRFFHTIYFFQLSVQVFEKLLKKMAVYNNIFLKVLPLLTENI